MKTTIFTNPLLEAQEACKVAVEKAGLEAIKIYNYLKEEGYISSFKFEMNPFNSGYEVQFEADYDFSKNKMEKYKNLKNPSLQRFQFGINSVYIYPNTSKNRYFSAKEGAYLTARSIDGYYENFTIKNSDDLQKMAVEFVKRNTNAVNNFLS